MLLFICTLVHTLDSAMLALRFKQLQLPRSDRFEVLEIVRWRSIYVIQMQENSIFKFSATNQLLVFNDVKTL